MISSFKKMMNLKNIGKSGIICNEDIVKNLTNTCDIIPISSILT